MSEVKNMNIYEKMSAITEEISRVAKNLNVGMGKSSYKAVGEADVLAEVKPAERKFNVYSYPFSREIVKDECYSVDKVFEDKKEETKTTETKLSMFMRVKTVYRFVNMDKPDEFIDIVTYGDGVDPQDKAPGKAMTYADKYALLKAYKIETGDDPDQNASQPMSKPAKQPAKKAEEQNFDDLPTKEHLARLRELGGTINVIAGHYQVEVDQVTDAMVVRMIEAKERQIAKSQQGEQQ